MLSPPDKPLPLAIAAEMSVGGAGASLQALLEAAGLIERRGMTAVGGAEEDEEGGAVETRVWRTSRGGKTYLLEPPTAQVRTR